MQADSIQSTSGKLSATLFAALGDATRLELIAHLSESGPTSVTKLASNFIVSRQAVAKHLGVMKNAGLAKCVRCGRESLWQLEANRIEIARRYLDLISNRWDAAFSRLRDHVEQ